MDLVQYLQSKLNQISPNTYEVSSERNVETNYEMIQVIVSALSGSIYKEAGNIPYQIDIVTQDIGKVMVDFNKLARQNNGIPFTELVPTGVNNSYESVTIVPFFNTPVVMEKEVEIGSNKYARIVVFAFVNEQKNVNNIASLKIDGEEMELLNGNLVYVVEADPARVSGQELTPSKKRTSSFTISFATINKSGVFLNKAFQIATGSLPGNTSFSVECTLDNGQKTTKNMFIGSYNLGSERTKLPSVNIGLFLYDNRGNTNATS